MIMNMKQKKIKIEPRIKLNYNIYRKKGDKQNLAHIKEKID